MLGCAPESVPSIAVKLTGNPIISGVRLATETAEPAEFERKPDVTVDVAPIQIGEGDALDFNCSQLAAAVPKMSPAAGPVFTPHQLLSLLLVVFVPPVLKLIILAVGTLGAELPTMRL